MLNSNIVTLFVHGMCAILVPFKLLACLILLRITRAYVYFFQLVTLWKLQWHIRNETFTKAVQPQVFKKYLLNYFTNFELSRTQV